ncbi:MAG TPA: DUF1670 domain-containing protein [Ignavibacteria bacterium]|nr:DUF1670 domain-containing protein [Ignavibacteria bacterium]HMR41011.1 DUF1670 domain-containing protein [Ignavibacteria bacterium]
MKILNNLFAISLLVFSIRKIIEILSEDIEDLHNEYYPHVSRVGNGEIIIRTTKDDGQRPSYGKKTEDYASITIKLPLITNDDIERRIYFKKGDKNSNYEHQNSRDIETMVRLLKSAKEQGGLLSGAELSMLMNRSLGTIGKYLKKYQESTGEILPLKGYVLDQGSLPTHKGIIIDYYENGMSPADIVFKTSHSQDAVDRYIKHYEQVKKLLKKGLEEKAIVSITGRSLNVVKQYIKLYKKYNPLKAK